MIKRGEEWGVPTTRVPADRVVTEIVNLPSVPPIVV